MSNLSPSFIFADTYGPQTAGVVVARIPEGISKREALFDALSGPLGFPSYFGRNWDALSDCLRDLSWLPAGRIAIIHGDLPDLEGNGTRIYIEVLHEAVSSWSGDKERSIHVVFPSSCEERVLHMAKDPR